MSEADLISFLPPDAARMAGLLGKRLDLMRKNRLARHEDEYLLWPFQAPIPVTEEGETTYRPGVSPRPDWTRSDWSGEFIGTWVAAAITVAVNAGDQGLADKVGHLVEEWIGCQSPDGYLGTYAPEDRWKTWDVWVNAHAILGLVSFHKITGEEGSLRAARGVADRLVADFGPGRRSLQATGPHGGMASSAVLEPMLWLYRCTGDNRYREFCEWIVDVDWEADGPSLMTVLNGGGGVADVANGKAAEMLIDCEGLLELYRITGKSDYLEAVMQAWTDLSSHHLYITGSASVGEFFSRNHELCNDGCLRIGETCVTMTWIALNLSLGRFTGEGRFFDMVEQAVYNHLLAAQSPDGRGWAYYVGLRDNKRFRWHVDPECCPTRGTRALAMLPAAVCGVSDDGIAVNLYEAGQVTFAAPDDTPVVLTLETDYPFDGQVRVVVTPERPTSFALRLRVPGWCSDWSVVSEDGEVRQSDERGYAVVRREWSQGDAVVARFEMSARFVFDDEGNKGRAAVVRGPLVFAADRELLPAGTLVDDVTLTLGPDPIEDVPLEGSMRLRVPLADWGGEGPTHWPGQRYRAVEAMRSRQASVELVPFFEAGSHSDDSYEDGVHPSTEPAAVPSYRVWLPFVLA